MINKNFFPTPINLIKEMLQGVDMNKVKEILEPSAGKGDIVNYLKSEEYLAVKYLRKNNFNIDVIEIEPDLQTILKSLDCKLIFDDFLKFHTLKKYDLILMNPPFDDGEKHLLKALELVDNGNVVCILNAETIRNPYTKSRQELIKKLDDLGAIIEFKEGAFKTAERTTNVDIALIKAEINTENRESIIIDNLKKAEEEEAETFDERDIVESDYLKMIISQFNFEAKMGAKLIKEYEVLKPKMAIDFTGDSGKWGNSPILELKLEGSNHDDNLLNGYLKKLRKKYWKALFDHKEFRKPLTSNILNELHSKIDTFKDYDFNFFNIYQLKADLSKDLSSNIEEEIIKLFDRFSGYSMDEGNKNIHLFSGWKTNSSWKINKKIIIPYYKAFDTYWKGEFAYHEYQLVHDLTDIEKILDYLDGKRTTDINIEEELKYAKSIGNTKLSLKYFDIIFYKKGTAHITFKDPDLLKKFNIYGSRKKGWLPPQYGKQAYHDFSKQEQDVIKSFDGGEKQYKEVVTNKWYMVDDINLIEGGIK